MNRATRTRRHPVTLLEGLRIEALRLYGIGGHIPAAEFAPLFNPVSAEDFARILYATDVMTATAGTPVAALSADCIGATIAANRFELKPHFRSLVAMFVEKLETHGPFIFE